MSRRRGWEFLIFHWSLPIQPGKNLSITDAYWLICNPIIAELETMGVKASCSAVDGAFCDGDYNVVVAGKKLVGTAQRRSRIRGKPEQQAILIHALLLFETDLELITAAVNRFADVLGAEESFASSVHCNLVDVCSVDYPAPTPQQFSQRLLQRYQTELKRFNSG